MTDNIYHLASWYACDIKLPIHVQNLPGWGLHSNMNLILYYWLFKNIANNIMVNSSSLYFSH